MCHPFIVQPEWFLAIVEILYKTLVLSIKRKKYEKEKNYYQDESWNR